MNPYQLNNLTPEQLHLRIMESPAGFSAEDDSIQYLGRQIQLIDGITALSGQTLNTAGSKQLLERLVDRDSDIQTKLSGSTAEAIEITASQLWDEFEFGAIDRSPTKKVQCAVFLKCVKLAPTDTIKLLANTHLLSKAEKLEIILAAEQRHPISERFWNSLEIPLSIRLEKAKSLFQRLPDMPSLAEEDNVISEQLTTLPPANSVKARRLEIRQILTSQNNELARQLLSDVDHIEKNFIPKAENYGSVNDDDFMLHTTRLLYLYAACSGFSREADIAELTSYIRSVLYSAEPKSIWHIAKELAYLSKQPGAIGYCRYIHAVANILKAPADVASQFEDFKQLSDIEGFALLESKPLDKYLTALRANITTMTPEYSQELLDAVNQLKGQAAAISLPEGKPDIKAKFHRLLMVIAACKSSEQIMDTSVLKPFVSIIMEHDNKNNIPYLISGLARLVQSSPKMQQILGDPGIKGGKLLRLAPLQLLAFVPDLISEDEVRELNQYLQDSLANRRQMKDTKVFHQWLITLELALSSEVMDKAMVLPVLKKLTQNLTYDKLGLLKMLFKTGDRFHEFLNHTGFSCQKEGLPLLIAEQGANALVGNSKGFTQWLFDQRYYHVLPSYMASMSGLGYTEITDLMDEFIESIANDTFIKTRQSPLNNPHLQAIYPEYPQFRAGWRANFSHFSEATRNKLLSPGETLELTEKPWDLFINGLEVYSCQSPALGPCSGNLALMSLVMDGRNAMIVKKNQKGNILSRSIIRMVLDQDNRPALFLELAYPNFHEQRDKSNLLFIDAARDIAHQMKLPLYHPLKSGQGGSGEEVKLLKGRAPYDYFDSFEGFSKRENVKFSCVHRDLESARSQHRNQTEDF